MTNDGLGVLALPTTTGLLDYLIADYVHILVDGQIAESGGQSLHASLKTMAIRVSSTQVKNPPACR